MTKRLADYLGFCGVHQFPSPTTPYYYDTFIANCCGSTGIINGGPRATPTRGVRFGNLKLDYKPLDSEVKLEIPDKDMDSKFLIFVES